MKFTKKLGTFIKNNKIELRASFYVVIALLLAISIEIFTTTYSRVATTPSNSRIEGTTAYIDDLTADLNYYEGLNYTEIRNTNIPSGTSTGYYDDQYLVKVELIYDIKLKKKNDDSIVNPLKDNINIETVNLVANNTDTMG